MQSSVQGCIRRFMLQKEAGCARLLPQRIRSSGLFSDTQSNGHGGTVCGEHPPHGRYVADRRGPRRIAGRECPRRKPRPVPPLRQFGPRQDGNVSGRIRRTQAAVSAVPFATVREFDQAPDKDMLSLFLARTSSARSRRASYGVSKSSFRISFRCIPFLLPSIRRSTAVPAGKAIGKASGAWVICRFWRRIPPPW